MPCVRFRTKRLFRMAVMRVVLLVVLLLASFLEGEALCAGDLLRWWPGKGVPQSAVLVERFKDNDLALEADGQKQGLCRFGHLSAVVALFTGGDPALLAEFQNRFAKYHVDEHSGLHPGAASAGDPDLCLYTYLAPYEYDQAEFLAWAHEKLGRDDIFLPAARHANPYRGNLTGPVVTDTADIDNGFLERTMGYAAVVEADRITLIGDNRYRPTRWIAPVNEIHHHEQAALSLVVPAAAGAWAVSSDMLRDYLHGLRQERLVLVYDVAVCVTDFGAALNETDVWDYYGGDQPPEGRDPTAQLHHHVIQYTQPDAEGLLPLEKEMIKAWVAGRLVVPNLHVSLGVNFRQREGCYRLAEMMLTSYHQQPSFCHPRDPNGKEPDCLGFYCTASAAFDPCVADGGNSGAVAWTRFPMDVLARPDFLAADPGIGAVLLEGGDYVELEQPHLPVRRFFGRIDLTAFYVLARAHAFFPGQRGYWVDRWVGFEGDAPEFRNPKEQHGVEWVSVIFENHGPFRIEVDIRRLEVVREPVRSDLAEDSR